MAENRNSKCSTLSPSSDRRPALMRTISNESLRGCSNEDGLPPLLVVIQASPKAPRTRLSSLPPTEAFFIPETAENAADLCDLYRLIWSEQVAPLSSPSQPSSPSLSGVKRARSQMDFLEENDEDLLQDIGDLLDEEDDDGDCMSIFSLDESILAELDAAFAEEIDNVRRQPPQIMVPPSTLLVEGLETVQRESNMVVDDEDDDLGSLASSVDTTYSFDADFELLR